MNEDKSVETKANINTPSELVADYPRRMGIASDAGVRQEQTLDFSDQPSDSDVASAKLEAAETLTMRRGVSVGALKETTRDHQQGMLHEEPLEIQCGEKTALLFVSKLCQGSKGPCILYGNEWLTPNELQYICGRETAKDWKRSIRHKGKSLKSLIAQGFLKVHPPICDCPGCRVSSPVNRTRLADKCGFSKIPSYLSDKSMVEGFPTMWRRNSTSSDEPDQATVLQVAESYPDEDPQPKRAHSDEPRYYQPAEHIQMTKRPRSSSPDLDRGRFSMKRRCLSEACPDNPDKPATTEQNFPSSTSLRRHATSEDFGKLERKCKMTDQELKREQTRLGTIRGSLVKDLPVLTIPSAAYPASVLYAHNQAHLGLHRHVSSPRLLSPTFVRPTSTASPQIRLLHEQASPLSASRIYAAQQLRQDYPNVGMATMFPYTFNHPLPGNQLLSSHFPAKLTLDMERHLANTGGEGNGASVELKLDEKEKTATKENDNSGPSRESSPPAGASSPKGMESEKVRRPSADEIGDDSTRPYEELANITSQWGVEEVCKFVNSVTGCSEYSEVFREQEIDGQAFILLTEDHLSNKMGIKLGPALKIKSKIDELRCVYGK